MLSRTRKDLNVAQAEVAERMAWSREIVFGAMLLAGSEMIATVIDEFVTAYPNDLVAAAQEKAVRHVVVGIALRRCA